MKENLSLVGMLFVPIVLMIIFCLFSLKLGLLFCGFYCCGMYLHMTINSFSYFFAGKSVDGFSDLLWRIIFMLIACICLSISFCV